MTLTHFQSFAWLLYIVVNPLLVSYLLYRRAAGRFPVLFSLLVFESITDPALYLLHFNYKVYFYAYWFLYPIQCLLRLAVIIDVVRSIPQIKVTSKETITSFSIVSTILIFGCIYLNVRGSGGWKPAIAGYVFGVERGVALVWLMLPLIVYFFIGTLGFGWSERGQRVGSANVILALLSLAGYYAISQWPNSYLTINAIQTLAVILVWLYIAWAVAGDEPPKFVLTSETKAEYKRLLSEYIF